MSCIAAYSDPGSVYPVFDPLRISAEFLPQRYAYFFAWDAVGITVENDPTLNFSACSMRVVLTTDVAVTWAKSIVGWNYFTNAPVGGVMTSGSDHGPHEMIVSRGMCSAGAHTLLLRKAMNFNVMTGLYTLNSDDLWTYWGGKKVTFNWVADNQRGGSWGEYIPTPTYPIVKASSVVEDAAHPGVFFLDVGGGFFRIGDAHAANSLGLSTNGASAATIIAPPAPVDFTLVQEFGTAAVFVTFGGAKFKFPSPAELFALGFNFNQVNQVPVGTLASVSNVPRDGTLLREHGDPHVFLTMGGQLHWIINLSVFQRLCLSWRNVRVVPHGSLGALPKGSDVT